MSNLGVLVVKLFHSQTPFNIQQYGKMQNAIGYV